MVCDWMICRHKLYQFTVTNTWFTTPLTRRGKTEFSTVKWYNLCLQIIQFQTHYPLIFFYIHKWCHTGLDKKAGGGWDHVLAAIQIPDLNIDEFLQTALEEGSYLLLYGYVVQRRPLCQELTHERVLVNNLLDWTSRAKPRSDIIPVRLL